MFHAIGFQITEKCFNESQVVILKPCNVKGFYKLFIIKNITYSIPFNQIYIIIIVTFCCLVICDIIFLEIF